MSALQQLRHNTGTDVVLAHILDVLRKMWIRDTA